MGGVTGRHQADARPRILIIVQNLPVPFDRRVWLECRALTAAGYDVTVVCPKGKGDPEHEVLEGVTLLKYRPYAPGGGALGFILEYAYSFLATARLVLRARRAGKFDVLQACNPPDIFWPIARWLRCRDGSRFVFDHHDLCPELYDSRFPDGSAVAASRAAGAWSGRPSGRPTTSCRRTPPMPRSRCAAGARPAPTSRWCGPAPTSSACNARSRCPHCGAVGGTSSPTSASWGPQDGVDLAVRAAAHVVHDLGRTDVAFTFMGGGDCYEELVALRDELGLQDYLELPGRVPDETVLDVLSTAAVGLSPDPKNPLNDVSTMNKTLEYMAFGLPVVAFDLKETRVSAGDAASYVESGDVAGYARAIVDLLDDADKRELMGKTGRLRIERGAGLAVPTRGLRRRLRRPRRPISSAGLTCAELLEHFSSPTGLRLVRTMVDRISHRGPDAAGLIDMSPGTRAAARASAAVDHRSVGRGGSAVQQGRPAPELQRRAVQLPRAPRHPPGPGRPVPDRVRHRGRPGVLAAVGAGRPRAAPRDVRVRDLRRAHRGPHAGPGSARHQADVRPAARTRDPVRVGAQGSGGGRRTGAQRRSGRARGVHACSTSCRRNSAPSRESSSSRRDRGPSGGPTDPPGPDATGSPPRKPWPPRPARRRIWARSSKSRSPPTWWPTYRWRPFSAAASTRA